MVVGARYFIHKFKDKPGAVAKIQLSALRQDSNLRPRDSGTALQPLSYYGQLLSLSSNVCICRLSTDRWFIPLGYHRVWNWLEVECIQTMELDKGF